MAAFSSLTDRLSNAFKHLKSKGKLSEAWLLYTSDAADELTGGDRGGDMDHTKKQN